MRDYVENYMVCDLESYFNDEESEEIQCKQCLKIYIAEGSDADDHNKFCSANCEDKSFVEKSRLKTMQEAKNMGARI